ncbi:hypothetical protein BOX15_Mlig018826g1 [Macrostomum lignano]|uniref:Uncharacterized protein n=2 Tax=Macrostomum lignano TaxID=282301 RepID=A0A267EA03_9PLAT|nr:hypothetical protein BOX15_Mlig018826g1 [Macrostomum lignano]
MTVDEETPLVAVSPSQPGTRVFWYRWYVLLVYVGLVTLQGAVWNHWGPIASSMKAVFNWDNATLGLLTLWGPITYVVSFYGWTLFLRYRGLRLPCLLSVGLVAVGCALKAIPFQSDAVFLAMCHACGVLNGFAGPVAMAAGTKLAAEWFPMNERVTAVAIAALSQSLGPTLSFLIGPLIVQDVNGTALTIGFEFNNTISAVRGQVSLYNYIDFGVAFALLLLTLMYFPSRPKLPPSISSQVERSTDRGLRHLGLNTWLIVIAYGIPSGVSGAFNAVLAINVAAFGIDETEADWIGFVSTAVSMAVGLVAGRIVDCFRRPRMALTSFLLMTASALFYAWLTLICDRLLPSGFYYVLASNILGISSMTAAFPLFYELACESAFPVGEETTTMVVTTANNVFSGVFLTVLLFPQAGTLWMNYLMTGSCLISLPLVFFFKEVYNRRQFDLQGVPEDRIQAE